MKVLVNDVLLVKLHRSRALLLVLIVNAVLNLILITLNVLSVSLVITLMMVNAKFALSINTLLNMELVHVRAVVQVLK